MTNAKYKILLRVYRSTIAKPVYRTCFYKQRRKINQNKRILDELVAAGLIKEGTGSDTLTITIPGVTALEQALERREDNRRVSFQFWLTASLSAAALTVSIIALLI